MRAENIAFIVPPASWYEFMYPTGILCLSSFLEQHGHPNVIVDAKIAKARVRPEARIKLIADYLATIQPRLVCFSSTHKDFMDVVNINKMLLQWAQPPLTIVGGAHPTYRHEDFLEFGFKYAAKGEGEKTLLEFVHEAEQPVPQWGKVAGLVWKHENELIVNTPRQLMSDEELSEAPMPAYDKIAPRYFDYNVTTIRGLPLRSAMLLTTRGCPFACAFCGCNLIFGRKLRFRAMDSIEKELNWLCSNRAIEGLWIVDDTFTINKTHCKSVAALLREYSLVWGCQARVDTVDEELLKFLRECGCIQLDFGVESGSERILRDVIKKGTTPAQIREAFRLAKQFGFRTLANIMIGLPTETMEELEQTKQLIAEISPDATVVSIATPLPGTELYKRIGVPIDPLQYAALNWNGSEMTSLLNKSEIKDIVAVHHALKKRYLLLSLIKAACRWQDWAWILTRKDRWQRLKAVVGFLAEHFTR